MCQQKNKHGEKIGVTEIITILNLEGKTKIKISSLRNSGAKTNFTVFGDSPPELEYGSLCLLTYHSMLFPPSICNSLGLVSGSQNQLMGL